MRDINVEIHSTLPPGTFLWYVVIKNVEGEGESEDEGDQPIRQKCRELKWSVRGPGCA